METGLLRIPAQRNEAQKPHITVRCIWGPQCRETELGTKAGDKELKRALILQQVQDERSEKCEII